jgi:beta-barrel assembly-enhancing protease
MKRILFFASTILSVAFFGCGEDRGVNFFSVQQDKDLGDSLAFTLAANPTEYPIWKRSTNENSEKAYAYLEGMMEDILKSEKFKYGSTFEWEITIINKDVMNAFAAPGGKLYFYTGLLKYLDDAASLAGVLGHEMAHADLRHSTQVMTKQYGFQLLLSILMGENQSQMEQLAADLALGVGSLKFSRDNEYDADRYSMYYLAVTKYEPLGIKSFFEKMLKEGKTSDTFIWLSTHPSDQQRIDNANKVYTTDSYLKSKMAGKTYDVHASEYATFKSWLP